MKAKFFLILIFILSIFVRVYKLREIPGEWFGDISNVHEYVSEILRGRWPFYFFQSPGPVYHYLIVPFILITGYHDYFTYKFASLSVSIIGLFCMYLFFKEIAGIKIALVAVLISSISFWYLVWSRLGNSQIMIPGLVALLCFYVARFFKNKKTSDLFWMMTVVSIGWITYPQTFILPPFIFIFALIFILINKKRIDFWKKLAVLFLVFLAGVSILGLVLSRQNLYFSGNFSKEGYVGEKIMPIFGMDKREFFSKLGQNLLKTYLMLHVAGDGTFRVNIPRQPQLDFVSGILFLVGLIFMFRKLRISFGLLILLSLLIFPLPSVSPAINPSEIPNSARTIAIIPFVYLLVGMGIKLISKNKLMTVFAVLLFFSISGINLRNYFITYARGLPENNLAPSRYIYEYIDKNIPANYNLYFGECCWGSYGEPEPKAISYQLKKKRKIVNYNRVISSCEEIEKPAVLVVRDLDKIKDKFGDCVFGAKEMEVKSDKGGYITKLLLIK